MVEAQEQRLALGFGQEDEDDEKRPKHWPVLTVDSPVQRTASATISPVVETMDIAPTDITQSLSATSTTMEVDVEQGTARVNLANRLANDEHEQTRNRKRQDEFGVLSAGNYNPVSVQMVVQVMPYGPNSRRAV